MSRTARIGLAVSGLAIFAIASSWSPDRSQPMRLGATTANDPRLAAIVSALPGWRESFRPARTVVDVVCLVPNESIFFDAIGAWDERHWFPVLIDEPELVPKFLRAFRPARVVRWPTSRPVANDRRAAALTAVARSWSGRDVPAIDGANTIVPRVPGAPGVVLAAADSSALCGGVALAAGRRQPLVFWDFDHGADETLTLPESLDACAQIAEILNQIDGPQTGLGDRGDFVTLAGDWPDRYLIPSGNKAGPASFDDLLGRDPKTLDRLAYTGRLLGPPPRAVYQAMCSLFLQPDAALLFNTYPERTSPWDEYLMDEARDRLADALPSTLVQGGAANREGWHHAFDPINPFGLVLINSSGGERNFRLRGGQGQTTDVPQSRPVAIYMIHSFSAAHPTEESTIAGRWLANGAFAYFGSMNEPYLAAFRTPTLVADLLAAGAPFAAATYKLPAEDETGTPWRLRLIGDPLYHLTPSDARPPRLSKFAPLDALESVNPQR